MENKIRLKNIQLCCCYGLENKENKVDQQFVIDIGVFLLFDKIINFDNIKKNN